MMRAARFGLGLALALASGGPAAATGEFSSGNWKGAAFFEGARFTHCAMVAPYINGWRLLFSVDRAGAVSLGLNHPKVEMFPGTTASIWIQVDNDPVVIRAFTAVRAQLVVTRFAANADWFVRLRKGKHLKVNAGKRLPNFNLAGVDEALNLLFACVAANRGA
jgi:hypothetical protein